METVTFVDGFGRPVQVKKDGVVTTAAKGSAPKDETVMIVSGRNVYDAFGRVAKAYYPVTELWEARQLSTRHLTTCRQP